MPRTQVSPVKILLDVGIDLDNLSSEEDYLSALKEGAAMLQVGGSKTDGRFKILTDEVRKVRTSRKISAPSAGMKITKKRISAQKLLNPAKLTPVKGGEGDGGGDLVVIKEKVVSIEALLGEQYRLQEENAKDAKQEAEKKRRSLKESLMEGGGKVWEGIKKVGQKVIEPFKNIWNKILGFLQTILFGRAVMKIWDWFSKEENIGKIDSIFKFLKDWWPALLAAYLVFGNGLTRFALGLIAKLGIWTAKLMGPVIKGLLAAAMKMGPWGWKAAAVIGTGLAIYGTAKMLGKDKEGENITEAVTTGVEDGGANQVDVERALPQGVDTGVGSGQSPIDTIRNEAINPLGSNVPNLKFNQGGSIPGSGPNTDTVPAMLTPGEFVMSRGAVNKWGLDTLENMNAAGGGTNLPGLGGGGGGTDSLTEQAKVKTFGSAILDFFSGDDGRSRRMTDLEMSQRMAGGGEVKQLGTSAAKRIKMKSLESKKTYLIEVLKESKEKTAQSEKSIAKSNPKVNVPKAPEKKKSTIAYEEQKVLAQQSQQNGQSPVRQDLPPIDAGAMISSSKIKTLGITV